MLLLSFSQAIYKNVRNPYFRKKLYFFYRLSFAYSAAIGLNSCIEGQERDTMRDRINRFLQGRYGVDDLNKFLMILTIVVVAVSLFIRIPGVSLGISVFMWLMLILIYFRMFSRNVSRRYAENLKYLQIRNKLFHRNGTTDRYHKIYLCPSCRQKIRVPKGRGKICITCPSCRREFIKRT